MLANVFIKLRKVIYFVTVYAFLFASLPAQAYLPPISNAQMYTLATQGNVRALRAAMQRGLNIDTLDRYGNTALCHAIIQRNYTAYNTLRAAGANPYHPCVRNLREGYYDSFLASKRVVPTTANSREAYAYMGEEEFMFSSATWWALGAVLLGGGLALALGGGGGGSNDVFIPVYPTTDYSLGSLAGTSRPSYPSTNPYDPAILLEINGGTITNGAAPDYNLGGNNPNGWSISNDSQVVVDGLPTKLTDLIDFNTSALDYGNYIQAAMKGVYGSTVNNGYDVTNPRYDPSKDYIITLGNNTTALVALADSKANNYSKININAANGTIGMIASQNSTATNATNGQITMNYLGSKDNHGVIGMYADTSSTIINNGSITGQDQSTSTSAGTMTGMRGQIVNQENPPYSKTNVQNNGTIQLGINANNREVQTSLVGMGSWIEDEFLNGSMLLSRAGFVYLDNLGKIVLNVALSGTGTYNAASEDGTSYLLQGIGGIVGMRADGNTIATNGAIIDINITDAGDADNTVTDNVAGMQSVHGGTITNNSSIDISGGNGTYGMLAVTGQGTNSEFTDGSHAPTLTNAGTINIDSVNGFGMASYNGGASINTGTITLAQQGTGIQHNTGIITNSGSIVLENGGVGLSMTQNGNIVNELNGTIQIDNSLANASAPSDENADSIIESVGILQQNGNVTNNGTITITNTTGAQNTVSYGIKSAKGNVTSTNSITISDALDSYAIAAENGSITNSGAITINNTDGALDGVGYGLKTTTGNISNSAAISISNKNESYAIATTNGNVVNQGDLTVTGNSGGASQTGYGINVGSGSITNNGDVTVTNVVNGYGIATANGNIDNNNAIAVTNTTGSNNSVAYGISGGNGYINNNNTITITNANEGYGIYTSNGNVTNNGNITLTNSQQTQNKTSYGIKADKGSVYNDANIYMNVTGDTTQGTAYTQGSYGIWGGEANITNAANREIVFSLQGNGMYTESGSNDNYGTITMQKGGTGMGTASGNATNHDTGTISMEDTGIGMSSGLGTATNDGTININGSLSTGMQSENMAVNNNIINVNGYGSKGMSVVADNAYITNNGEITIDVSNAQSVQNYGMYGETGLRARMVNNNNISITGRPYTSTTTNQAYGMYLDHGEASNYGNITIDEIFGYGMYQNSGGTLDNYDEINLNYGGIGMGSGGNPDTSTVPNESAAMTNHTGATITINGQSSYGMKGDGVATAWNDGTIKITGDDSYGIYTTNGEGVNTNSITMNSSGSTGMASVSANTTNKATGTITIKGEDSVGMSTESGGTTADSQYGAVNEGIINIETTASNSTGMTVTGNGVANNKNQINVMASNSSGMLAQGDGGKVTNSGMINISGDTAYGMESTAGTATNSGQIVINSDNSYGMYANGDSAQIVNGANGIITIDDASNSTYAMYVNNGEGINDGTLAFDKQGMVAMYVGTGSITNNNTINLIGDNSVGMYGSEQNGATLTNNAGKSGPIDYEDLPTFSTSQGIIVSGTNSTGMKAGGNTTATNAENGVITVKGTDSYGMVATGVIQDGQNVQGTAINNGIIIVEDPSSDALYADGGIVENGVSGMIYTQGSTAINVNSGSGVNRGIIRNDSGNFVAMALKAGSIENRGQIILNGNDSVGMQINGSGTANNSLASSIIEVNGENSIGMQASNGTATNKGTINVNGGTGSVAMQADGGTIVNNSGSSDGTTGNGALTSSVENGILMLVNSGSGANSGVISSGTLGLTAMRAVTGSISNSGTISLSGNSAVGMNAVNGSAQNTGTINISGSQGSAMTATGSGSATNSGEISVDSADGYAMYADGGTIINASGGTISTAGSSALFVQSGSAQNQGNIDIANRSFHAIHVVNGSGSNSGTITLGGDGASGIYILAGSATNASGKIELTGNSAYGINGADGTNVNITNSAEISVANGIGIANDSGSITNAETGKILDSLIGITTESGKAENYGTITASQIGMQSTGRGNLYNYADAVINVSGPNGVGMSISGGGTATNDGTINVTGKYGMQASGSGSSIVNSGTINLTNGEYGMYATGGASATNTGTIELTGGQASLSNAMSCVGGGTCLNNGTVIVNGETVWEDGQTPSTTGYSMLRNSLDGYSIGPNGKFVVQNTSGTLKIDSSVTQGSLDTEYTIKNALKTDTIQNVSLLSSAWMSPSLRESEPVISDEDTANSDSDTSEVDTNSGTIDVAQDASSSTSSGSEMKSYDIVIQKNRLTNVLAGQTGIQDVSVLNSLDDAYEAGRNSQVFDVMKTAYTASDLNNTIKKELGLDFFANFAKQNLDVIKSADRQMNTALFNNNSDKDVRFTTGYDFMSRRQDATAYQTDYEDQAHSVFGMLDKKFNNNFRYGIGVLMSNYTSDYDSEASSRDELMIQVLLPLSLQFDNTKLVSIPRFGMGFGEYTRRTQSGKYEADTTNYYYGITNELRHNFDMGWFGLEPTLEFNILGMHQDKIKESGALQVDAVDSLSIEAGAGLYATKLFEFGEGHNLKLRAGGTIYQELADPYKAPNARLRDANIYYSINSYDADRTRGVLSLRADYNYQKFNFYGELNKYIETDDAYSINAGLGYKF